MFLPSNQKGSFVLWFVFLIVIVVISGMGGFFVYKQTNKKIVPSQVEILTSVSPKPLSTPTPSPGKIYTNTKYDFEVTYPAVGVVIDKEGTSVGECGNMIKEDGKGVNEIILDNFFGIKVINWDKSIDDYMKSKGAFEKYNIEIILNSGADEAIALTGLKPNVEYARGYPPLAYVIALFKKDDQLFLMQTFQNPGNFGGCISPSIADPSAFPDISRQKWEMPKSLKFIKL